MVARPEQGFPSGCRIRTSREYSRLWRQGRRCHTAQLLVIAASGTTQSRMGVSVGRKVGNAVCRNRIKRWLREYFRMHRAQFLTGNDISIVVKPGAAQLGHAELDQQLREALRCLRVYEDI